MSGSRVNYGVSRKGKTLLPLLVVLALAGLVVAGRMLGLGEKVVLLRDWIDTLGVMGPFVFVAIYIAAVVLAVPGSAMTALAGALFGSVLGVIVVSAGSTVGAALCFLIARFLARKRVAKRLAGNPHFEKLDAMTERHGALMVAVTRLVPIFPFNVLNYGFGLTGIPFATYIMWSWLCMLPGTVLYVVGADTVTRSLAEGRVSPVLLLVLVLAGIIITLLVRAARRKIGEEKTERDEEGTGHER